MSAYIKTKISTVHIHLKAENISRWNEEWQVTAYLDKSYWVDNNQIWLSWACCVHFDFEQNFEEKIKGEIEEEEFLRREKRTVGKEKE